MRYLVLIAAMLVLFAGCAGEQTKKERQQVAELEAKGHWPVKRVPPMYPRRAALAGIQGCTVIAFDVMPSGHTDNFLVIDSKPEGLFVNASLLALRDWVWPEREEPVRIQQTITYFLPQAREDERPVCETDPDLPEVYRVKEED